MRKILVLILGLMMVISIVACGDNNDSSTNSSNQELATTQIGNVPLETKSEIDSTNDEQETGEPIANVNTIPITITVGETIITAKLDNSKTSQELIDLLPQTIPLNRWEDREYYGTIQEALSDEGELQNVFENGDVAYWPSGRSLALFFDKNQDPKLSSPVIIIGKITSDLEVFNRLGEVEEFKIELVN